MRDFRGAARAALVPTVALGLMLLASACSGGGGGSTPAPTPTPTPPANVAPSFTSPTTASVAENTIAAYQAAASDPEGDPRTFSIAGGVDAARFAITAQGAVTFVTAPNFDNPTDADGDNAYLVQIGVSDGRGGTATLNLTVTVTNVVEGVSVTRLGSGLGPAVAGAFTNQLNIDVLTRTGGAWRFNSQNGGQFSAPIAGTPMTGIDTTGERGVLFYTIGQAPTSPTPDLFPAYYAAVVNAAGNLEIRRGGAPVITIPYPADAVNFGGWLAVYNDELFIATGDGGGPGRPDDAAQDPRSLRGKILRIIPRNGGGYTVPGDNPFANGVAGAPEVWASGFRNPARGVMTRNARELLVGDRGDTQLEELDLVRPQDAGRNYGWPFREGTQTLRAGAPAGVVDPVLEYAHGNGFKQGNAITPGGIFYNSRLFVFGDFANGNIWTVPVDSLVQGTTLRAPAFENRRLDFAPDTGSIDRIAGFFSLGGSSTGNSLYIVDYDGELYRATGLN